MKYLILSLVILLLIGIPSCCLLPVQEVSSKQLLYSLNTQKAPCPLAYYGTAKEYDYFSKYGGLRKYKVLKPNRLPDKYRFTFTSWRKSNEVILALDVLLGLMPQTVYKEYKEKKREEEQEEIVRIRQNEKYRNTPRQSFEGYSVDQERQERLKNQLAQITQEAVYVELTRRYLISTFTHVVDCYQLNEQIKKLLDEWNNAINWSLEKDEEPSMKTPCHYSLNFLDKDKKTVASIDMSLYYQKKKGSRFIQVKDKVLSLFNELDCNMKSGRQDK